MSTMLNESQAIVLLRTANEALFQLPTSLIKQQFPNEKDLIDAIIPYIKDQSNAALRLYAVEVIKTMGFKASHLIHELITIFLSLTTITNADLTSQRQVLYNIYLTDKSQMRPEASALHESVVNLNYQSMALSSLVGSLPQSLGGVPLALINQTLNVAQGMILKHQRSNNNGESLKAN